MIGQRKVGTSRVEPCSSDKSADDCEQGHGYAGCPPKDWHCTKSYHSTSRRQPPQQQGMLGGLTLFSSANRIDAQRRKPTHSGWARHDSKGNQRVTSSLDLVPFGSLDSIYNGTVIPMALVTGCVIGKPPDTAHPCVRCDPAPCSVSRAPSTGNAGVQQRLCTSKSRAGWSMRIDGRIEWRVAISRGF
jgi:hypothetical protein